MGNRFFLALQLLLVFIQLGIAAQLNGQISANTSLTAPQESLFRLLPAELTGVDFTNTVIESPSRNISDYDYFYNGGGLAIGDLNNDGLPDLVFAGNDAADQIYFNKGGLQFEAADMMAAFSPSAQSWSTGISLVDINNDGWLDIYVCKSGPDFRTAAAKNELYINLQNGRFKESAEQYGIADPSLSTQAVFFDADGDGDKDIFVLNHGVRNWANQSFEWLEYASQIPAEQRQLFSNTFYMNNGEGKFENITAKVGVDAPSFGLGVVASDFDGDGRTDLFVTNDYFLPDRLYLNRQKRNGGLFFTDAIQDRFAHASFYSMGCDLADINNDGLQDLMVVDMTPSDHFRSKTNMASMDLREFRFLTEGMRYLPQYMFNSLYLNQAGAVMSDIAQMAGVATTDWSWSPLLADFDNDGFRDLYITNGVKRDIKNNDWRIELRRQMEAAVSAEEKERVYYGQLQNAPSTPLINPVFKNLNGLQFEPQPDWGMQQASFSNGAAYGDLDQDGDLEIVVNALDQPALIYENKSDEISSNNWIRFSIKEDFTAVKIVLTTTQGMLVAENNFVRGYQSYVEPVIHFGLGNAAVEEAAIYWSSDSVSYLSKPKDGKTHHLKRSELVVRAANKNENNFGQSGNLAPSILIDPVDHLAPLIHQENKFDEYAAEPLLPHLQSRKGPGVVVADFNGDGIEEVFLGGAKGFACSLHSIDQTRADWSDRLPSGLAAYENNGAAAVDFDQDGDLDIYMANGGGSDFSEDSSFLADLLLENDGKGYFSISEALPKFISSTKTIAPCDWDQDGDMDLFVGGANLPGKYPLSPESFFLENQNGRFINSTQKFLPSAARSGTTKSGSAHLGMISDAAWMDWDEDGKLDLLLVGEWMTLTVFINKGDHFKKTIPFQDLSGWWQSITVADFDGDKDKDLLLGNLGLNNKFHPSPESPLHIFASDFDENGRHDIVLGKVLANESAGEVVGQFAGKGTSLAIGIYPTRGRECSAEQVPALADKFPSYKEFATADLAAIYPPEKLESSTHLVAHTFESMLFRNEGNAQFEQVDLPLEAQIFPIKAVTVSDFNRDGKPDLLLAGNIGGTEVETTAYDAGTGLMLIGQEDCSFTTAASSPLLLGDIQQIAHFEQSGRSYFILVRNNSYVEFFQLAD